MSDSQLKLDCQHTPGDWLEVDHYPDTSESFVLIDCSNANESVVALSREQVRALFSRLGVWLHQ